jgi:demethylspheroidene O-methyltransferase
MSPRGQNKPASWQDRLLGARDRLLASPRFQRWATRFPLTRGITRRKAGELFDIAAGFVYSQVLYAVVECRLPERLAAGPRDSLELADAIGLPAEGAARLFAAAESLRLLERRSDGRIGLGERGAAMLGNPGIAAMVRHHRHLYADLQDPLSLLRERRDTRLSAYWAYARSPERAGLGEDATGEYSALMGISQPLIADDILDACPLRGRRHLLDLAGGEGVFASAALDRWPTLQATVFDLPAVAGRANATFASRGLRERAEAVGGDLFAADPPPGADTVSLVRVLHDHDDAPARAILRFARRALGPGGRLLVAEPMAQTPGAEPMGDAYFGFYLLAMGSGRPRSAVELRDMILEAGFRRCRELATHRPLLVRVLLAEV